MFISGEIPGSATWVGPRTNGEHLTWRIAMWAYDPWQKHPFTVSMVIDDLFPIDLHEALKRADARFRKAYDGAFGRSPELVYCAGEEWLQ